MKKRIKETGEVKELLPEFNDIPCVIWKDEDNRYYNPEEVIDVIDWEQRRYELVKAAMQGNLPTSVFDKETFCKYCISIADEMITQLKS